LKRQGAFGASDILTYLGFANRKLHRYDVAETYYRARSRPSRSTSRRPNIMASSWSSAAIWRGEALLAKLDALCTFGCFEADELRQWIAAKGKPAPDPGSIAAPVQRADHRSCRSERRVG
jgi:hypothetical protein